MTQADRISQWANVPLSLAQLVVSKARNAHCPLKKLRSECRDHAIVAIRHRIARAAEREGYSYSAIGRALNRDHSTIMYVVKGAR